MKKIMLSGPSGLGKTTLAHCIAESMAIPFVSGSISDVEPSTRVKPQYEMIEEATLKKEFNYISNRYKEYSKYDNYITDRSYLDNIAYGIHKLSHKIPHCDMKSLMVECTRLIFGSTCDVIILLQYNYRMMKDTWVIEDNNKRVTSQTFQALMSKCFELAIDSTLDISNWDNIDDYIEVADIYPQSQTRVESNKPKKLINLHPLALQQGVRPIDRPWYGKLVNYLHNNEI